MHDNVLIHISITLGSLEKKKIDVMYITEICCNAFFIDVLDISNSSRKNTKNNLDTLRSIDCNYLRYVILIINYLILNEIDTCY